MSARPASAPAARREDFIEDPAPMVAPGGLAASPRPAPIAYFVHDASHPDIARRVDLLVRGGARVRVLGFQRGEEPAKGLIGVVQLGRTRDARLTHRALAVLSALLRVRRWDRAVDGAEVVIARNLETLALAVVARGRRAKSAKLVYECLDIHHLMSGRGAVSSLLRFIERLLLRRVDALLVSSPGFVREYFAKQVKPLPEVILVENKVGVGEHLPARAGASLPAGPPWKIGWFGVIRCRRSLDLLVETARRHPGLLEVVIAGRAATNVVGDLARELPEGLGVRYVGEFQDEAALAKLFRSVHFAWLIDFYEAGANSEWLLPNRLYRAAYYGAVPIALAGVETGRWLQAHGAGVLLDAVSPARLAELLRGFTAAEFASAKAAVDRVPTEALVSDPAECVALVDRFRKPC